MTRLTASSSVIVGLLLLLTMGCGSATDDGSVAPVVTSPVRGGTLVIGSKSDVQTWNEYLNADAPTMKILRRLYLPLARMDDEVVPQLAESWTFSEDGLALTFNLRQANWSDGTPITAADVRFTWEAQIDEAVGWASSANKRFIADVEVVDPQAVTFHFEQSYPDMLADAIDGGILPAHIFREIPLADWKTHDWRTVDVVSGPFKLAEHTTGQQVRLVRNPAYHDAANVYLDEVVIRIVPDDSNLMQQLQSGDVDFVDGIPQDAADRLADQSDLEVRGYRLATYDYIGWNGDRPPLDNPRVRQALTMAIDRVELVDTLLFGYGQVANGPVPSSHPAHDSDLAPWKADAVAARQQLHEAGVESLRITLLTNAGNRIRSDAALRIQSQLAAVGVELEIRTVELGALRRQVAGGDYDAYLGGWNFSGKIELTALFHSTRRFPDGFNLVGLASPEVDEILDRLDTAADAASYRDAAVALQRVIHDLQPYTFLFEKERVAGWRQRLRGVELPDTFDTFAHLESFWLADAGG